MLSLSFDHGQCCSLQKKHADISSTLLPTYNFEREEYWIIPIKCFENTS